MYLWINGEYVGYSDDSYTAAEFDITKFLKPAGETNTIAVRVYRWSDGSYLEDQDFIRMSGIFRDTFLYAKDQEASLFDFNYTTDLDDQYVNADLNVEATLRSFAETAPEGYSVDAILFDKNGKKIAETNMPATFKDGRAEFKATIAVESTAQWSAEHPNLYQLVFALKNSFDNVAWYGKGPDENYIDRQSGFDVGIYEKEVEDFFVDYIKPQETGNRTGVRWVSLTNNNTVGLLAKAEGMMEFNALFYTPEQLNNYLHSYMLPEGQDITLRLNHRQMGVGGDNSWGARPLEKYQNPADQTYTYTLKPVSSSKPAKLMADYRASIQ